MRILRSRKWRAAVLTGAVFAVTAGGVLYRHWPAVTAYVERELWLAKYRRNAAPVARGLADGSIKAGDSVDEVIAAYPPKRLAYQGPYTYVEYQVPHPSSGRPVECRLYAIDGKLVQALIGPFEPSGNDVVFDTVTTAESFRMSGFLQARHLDELEAAWSVAGTAVGYFPDDLASIPKAARPAAPRD